MLFWPCCVSSFILLYWFWTIYNFQSIIFSQPLEVREICPDRCYSQYSYQLGVWSPICSKKLQGIVKLASALESGRYVARDIGKSRSIPGTHDSRYFIEWAKQVFLSARGKEIPGFRHEFPLLVEEISFGEVNRPRLPTCTREIFWLPVNRAQLAAPRVSVLQVLLK